MSTLSWKNRAAIFALVLAVFALAALALLSSQQRRILYPGTGPAGTVWTSPPAGYREIAVMTADGLILRAYFRPATGGRRTVLFFHGNGDTVAGSAQMVEPLVDAGYGAFLAEFRGYAGNPDMPNEQGLYRDGEAARDRLRLLGVADEQMIIAGYSLGTGVASWLAAKSKPAALIMIASFTSVPDAAAQHFGGWIKPLVRDHYATSKRIGRIRAPILLIHGADDRTVPASNSATLKALRPDADLVVVPGHGHVIAYDPIAAETALRWLADRRL